MKNYQATTSTITGSSSTISIRRAASSAAMESRSAGFCGRIRDTYFNLVIEFKLTGGKFEEKLEYKLMQW